MHGRLPLSLSFLVVVTSCDQFQATADRAMQTLQGKPPTAPSGSSASASRPPTTATSIPDTACPDAVEGRAAGAETPEAALSCFRRAIANESAATLLRVTCRGRNAQSCKQSDATLKEAERAMPDLKKTPWTTILGRWEEGTGDKRAVVFAIDTRPGDKLVSTVVTCKIAEGGRWAICELGDLARETAAQKSK